MTTSSPPEQFTTVDGHRLAQLETGRGDPIVLLHGNPTSSRLWRDVMPTPASPDRVIAPDPVGHGDSDMTYPFMKFEVYENVAWITFNRPAAFNAINFQSTREFEKRESDFVGE